MTTIGYEELFEKAKALGAGDLKPNDRLVMAGIEPDAVEDVAVAIIDKLTDPETRSGQAVLAGTDSKEEIFGRIMLVCFKAGFDLGLHIKEPDDG